MTSLSRVTRTAFLRAALCFAMLSLFSSSNTAFLPGPPVAIAQPADEIAERVRTAPRGSAAYNIAHFSPDGTRITTMTPGGTMSIWDLSKRKKLQRMPGQVRYTYEATWSPDGSTLASASVDGTVHLWDVATGQRTRVLDQFSDGSPTMGGGITRARFSPDGRYLAALQRYTPGRVVIWDMNESTERMRIEKPQKIYAAAWDDSGNRMYTAEEDGTVYAWSVPDGTVVAEWAVDEDYLFDVDAGDTRIVAGGRNQTVHVIDTRTNTVAHRFDHSAFVNGVAVVPDTPYVASVSSDGMLKIWNTDTGSLHVERFAHNDNTYSVTVSPDRRTLATVGRDRYVRFWDVETGDLVHVIANDQRVAER
jgi:WD40 repeat protein